MAIDYLTVGVVVERREIDSPWADHVWAPVAVLPDAPDVAPWTSLGRGHRSERFYAGPAVMALFPSDTTQLIENFVPGAGKIWVSVRPTGIDPPLEVVGVTADPTEGEGYLEGASDIVEALPMPEDVAQRVLAFYRAHHVERPFVKRKRDKAGRDAFTGQPGRGDRTMRTEGGRVVGRADDDP
jgi:Protein of unknown function (DUF3305)